MWLIVECLPSMPKVLGFKSQYCKINTIPCNITQESLKMTTGGHAVAMFRKCKLHFKNLFLLLVKYCLCQDNKTTSKQETSLNFIGRQNNSNKKNKSNFLNIVCFRNMLKRGIGTQRNGQNDAFLLYK